MYFIKFSVTKEKKNVHIILYSTNHLKETINVLQSHQTPNGLLLFLVGFLMSLYIRADFEVYTRGSVSLSSDADGISQSELTYTLSHLSHVHNRNPFHSFLPQTTKTVPTHTYSILSNKGEKKKEQIHCISMICILFSAQVERNTRPTDNP